MKYDPQKHHRRSIRLKGYDYSQQGAYFVTLVTHERQCLFGEVVDGEMVLNEYGKIVYEEWFLSTKIRNEIVLHKKEFIVMPNHIHGIVWIKSDIIDVGITEMNGTTGLLGSTGRSTQLTRPNGPANKSLSSFIAGYKSSVTKRINQIRQAPGVPVWQRNYYEHIIRNESGVNKIREYILNNPSNWKKDDTCNV